MVDNAAKTVDLSFWVDLSEVDDVVQVHREGWLLQW